MGVDAPSPPPPPIALELYQMQLSNDYSSFMSFLGGYQCHTQLHLINHFLFYLRHFGVIYDLLLDRCVATWNL